VPFPPVVACSNAAFTVRDDREWAADWRTQNLLAPHLRTGISWTPASLCAEWPIPPANPPHRLTVGATPPILTMSSLHDPATDHTWAVDVTGQIPRATLLSYDGWGHGVTGRTPCTTGAAERYLVDLAVPPPGTHCPAASPDDRLP
jgi:hypothetical protein